MPDKPAPDSPRARLERFWDPLVTMAAVMTIPLLLLDGRVDPAVLKWWDTVIWATFTLEVVTVFAVCRTWAERFRWLGDAWMQLVIIVGTFPWLPNVLHSLRLMQLTRMARLLRVGQLFVLGWLVRWAARRFALHPMAFAGSVAFVSMLIAANALHVVEPQTAPNVGAAMWWAMTTVTTVGYGDVVPGTPQGRVIGVMLMLVGVAAMAAFTAGLASFVVTRRLEHEEEETELQLRELRREIAELRLLLQEARKGAATEPEDPA